jgi:hypothetical protein
MYPKESQNVEARIGSLGDPGANSAAQGTLEDLAPAEWPRVVGGANVLAPSAGDGPVLFDFNPWYSLTYARFAIRTGAPL